MAVPPLSPASADAISGAGHPDEAGSVTHIHLGSRESSPSLPESYRSVPIPGQRFFFSKNDCVRGARLPCGRRLYGPWKLGDGLGWRLEVWLHASQRRADFELHGDFSPGAFREARNRDRARPGAGLPRTLFAADDGGSLDALRNCDRGVRSGGSARLRGGAETAVRAAAARGRLADWLRCAACSGAARPRVSSPRDAGHHIDRDDWRMFRV